MCVSQDVVDFVSWFKKHRDPSITVGITKVRQITFQMVPRVAETEGGGVGVGVGGGATDCSVPVDPHVLRSERCGGCLCCTLVSSVEQLPKTAQTEIRAVLTKHGLDIPTRTTGKFTAAFTRQRVMKRKFEDMDCTTTDWQYLMTYKTSMYVGETCWGHAAEWCIDCAVCLFRERIVFVL